MVAMLVGLSSLVCARPAEASHFRYGHITWRRTGRNTVQLTLTCAFRRSGYVGTAKDGMPAVGDTFDEDIGGTELDLGDGSVIRGTGSFPGMKFVTVAIDPDKDLVIGRAIDPTTGRDRITHTYPSANNSGQPWIAQIFSSARIGALNNNAGGLYRILAEIDLSKDRNSAVSSLPPIIPVPEDPQTQVSQQSTFVVPGVDDDRGTKLLFRLSTSEEASGDPFNFIQPPGATIDPNTGLYTVPAGLDPGLWSTQVTIEELDPVTGKHVGQVAVDFSFNVVPVTGNPPSFVYRANVNDTTLTPVNGSTLTVIPGTKLTFTVVAKDPDGDPVTLNTTGPPLGSVQNPPLPVVGKTASSVLTWTPGADDVGAYSVTYTAEDLKGGFAFTTVNICVIPRLKLLEPNGGEAYLPGTPVTISWETVGCERMGGVRLELSRDGGVTFTEVITPKTDDSGEFIWTAKLPQTRRARIRIINLDDPTDFDVSDGDFAITSGLTRMVCTTGKSVDIPDNEPNWTAVPINFPADLIVRGLFVHVDITHPFVGDLEVELVAPTSAGLIEQGQDPLPGDVVLLHDETGEGTKDIHTIYGSGKTFTAPIESLTKLYGRSSAGKWYLRVRDLNPGDVGTLDRWCLEVVGPLRGIISVTSPKGGELLPVGVSQTITWTEKDTSGILDVLLSRDNGVTFTKLGTVNAGVKKLVWNVIGPPAEQAIIRVISEEDPVITADSGVFSIRNASVKVIQPNGGETLATGRQYAIKWEDVPNTGTVTIELSQDGGRTFPIMIAKSAPDSGSFLWNVPAGLDTTQGRIRITAKNGPARFDLSDKNFTIVTPKITVTAANGGETWYTSTPQTIRWDSSGVDGPVRIELFRNGKWETLAASTANDGEEAITLTGSGAADARIRVTSLTTPTVSDTSDRAFTIKPMKVTVLSPNGGNDFGIGTTQTLAWSTDGAPVDATVDVDISRDGGAFTPLFTATANDGKEDWVVKGPPSKNVVLRVKLTGLPVFDVSDRPFSIVDPKLTVTSPNGGETLRVGKTATLTWNRAGVEGPVKIEISRNADDAAPTWETLFESTDNDGKETWTVTGPDTDGATARLRITSVARPDIQDVSDRTFTILTPSLDVISPNGGEQWFTETTQTITWRSEGVDPSARVQIELTRDGGARWETLLAGVPNTGKATWQVSGDASSNARVRITVVGDLRVTDQSDGPFSITRPSITVGAPSGGEEWLLGSTQTLRWASEGVTGNVNIELSRDGGSTWKPLFMNTANDGTQPWPVTGEASSRALIRITSVDRPSVSGKSDRTFSISQPTLVVTAPGAGTRWPVGSRQSITWTGTTVTSGEGTVDIQLSRNGGRSYQTIIGDTANDGLATWLVSGPNASSARIRIVWKANANVQGVSGSFAIGKARRTRRRR